MRGIGWVGGLLGVGLVFLFGAQAIAEVEYQDYLSALPESIQGMERSGEPERVNRQGSGQDDVTMVKQGYTGDRDEAASLTILVGEEHPAHSGYKRMSQLHMENPQKLIQSLEVAGYDGVMELDKTDGEGTVAFSLGPETLVVLDAKPVSRPDELQALAGEIPLREIDDQTP